MLSTAKIEHWASENVAPTTAEKADMEAFSSKKEEPAVPGYNGVYQDSAPIKQ